ncbi:MAG: proline--tRNA ligase [Planctomycetaceae bacterium]|nr:proline--tRNA ligase [Planctomycetaceae bacterium]MCP4462934.1 proline--tRNA ligase [Planctomycetaceae bacterium]MDG1806548.1 proline--tRNA ligase [Pirellulaceae bacterium]MDG2105258.1 proline--tRNA ligase [Pirellulaceae bacterium]
MAKNAITPTRSEDYPEWYQAVIKAAELAEVSPVRGCMVIKPWGYGIWENMQRVLDEKFKETGHENAYFPIFIPKSFLEKEAEHVEGFAKECAVVTHHRLEEGADGGLVPAGPLDEPLVVRPTSETIIGHMFAKWVQSHRDLPILINQWCNVVRWELRTRLFLRTAEFLWQEGHTAHATSEEAWEETRQMLDVYADFAENTMAMPVIKGEKTAGERFPGAVSTLTIEAMMQDRKALQAGTSHFLGQNFSKAQDIKFQSEAGQLEHAWTTSWGLSTRMVGALIMSHSDDDGLVLPPKLAPKQIVILPIYRSDEERAAVLEYCDSLKQEIGSQRYHDRRLQVMIDDRDLRGGEKKWYHVKRGVPLRLEIGPRDIAENKVFVGRRDQPKSTGMDRQELVANVINMLDEMQQGMFDRALQIREDNTHEVNSLDEFKKFFTPKNAKRPEIHGGFAYCHFVDCDEVEQICKDLKVTIRCIPLEGNEAKGTCIFTGQPSQGRAIFAKSY